jgi:hypothetical protein
MKVVDLEVPPWPQTLDHSQWVAAAYWAKVVAPLAVLPWLHDPSLPFQAFLVWQA